MIGPEDINQLVKAALHLVIVIGDIGGEIGPTAIRFLHRPVHIIAVIGRAKQSLLTRLPIFRFLALWRLQDPLINQSFGLQIFNCSLNEARAVERFFGIEGVHLDAQLQQVGADHVHHRFGGKLAHRSEPFGLGRSQEAVAEFCLERLTRLDQVIAGIGAIGPFD